MREIEASGDHDSLPSEPLDSLGAVHVIYFGLMWQLWNFPDEPSLLSICVSAWCCDAHGNKCEFHVFWLRDKNWHLLSMWVFGLYVCNLRTQKSIVSICVYVSRRVMPTSQRPSGTYMCSTKLVLITCCCGLNRSSQNSYWNVAAKVIVLTGGDLRRRLCYDGQRTPEWGYL